MEQTRDRPVRERVQRCAVGAVAALWAFGLSCLAQTSPGAKPQDPQDAGPALHETVAHAAMGTEFHITLYARPGDNGTSDILRLADEAFQAIDDLDARVSHYRPDSQVSYLNNHAASGPVRVAPDVLELILFSQEIYRESGGAFDPTVGPLIRLWGFFKGEGHLPTDAELAEARAKVGFDKVTINEAERTVFFAQPGMSLDFGGIAKGLALDEAAELLKKKGVTSAVLDAGTSSVVAIGAPPDAPGWTVNIRDPYNADAPHPANVPHPADKSIDQVVLRDESLSTSGSYEKFFELEGKKYCHIFDPRTGMPVEGILSATCIAPTGMWTDALSTAFFVMGVENTRAYCRSHPEVRAILAPTPERGTEGSDRKPQPIRINFGEREQS